MKAFNTLSACALICTSFGVAPSATLAAPPETRADVSRIELRRLFEPTASELAAEALGRIYIYEGLRDIDVRRAMDEEFDRVESMMFIRLIKTDETGKVERDLETGEVVTTDDGC
jgi:hypothetical protein